jgi:hypothetical protein
MEPRFIAKKCDVHSIYSLSSMEVSKPLAISQMAEVVTFFQFLHWCNLTWLELQFFFQSLLCWWIWDACCYDNFRMGLSGFALVDQRCPLITAVACRISARHQLIHCPRTSQSTVALRCNVVVSSGNISVNFCWTLRLIPSTTKKVFRHK